jgi:hypothetical protein
MRKDYKNLWNEVKAFTSSISILYLNFRVFHIIWLDATDKNSLRVLDKIHCSLIVFHLN